MARYVVVAHQTAASSELVAELRDIMARDGQADFTLLVPATPVGNLMVWEEGESLDIAQRTAAEARRTLEQAGIPVSAARVGDHMPVDALLDELRKDPGYAGIVLSTFPPGVSKWLGMDLPAQIRRKFPNLPVTHVVSEPLVREDVAEGRHYQTNSLQ